MGSKDSSQPPNARPPFHRRPAGRLAFTLAILLGVLVLSEISLRIISARARQREDTRPGHYSLTLLATYGQTSLSDHDGRLKLVLDPFVTYRNLPNQHDPWFTINSRGYRGPEPDPDPAVTRIVLVGGSAAFGSGAESDEATIARALERRLPNTQVINAAVNGHVSTDELTLLQKELLDLNPALVIALDSFNDATLAYVLEGGHLQTNSTFRDLELRLVRLQAIESNPLRGFWTLARSIFPEVLSRAEKLERLPNRVRQDFYGEMPDDPLEPKIRNYTANVLKMESLCRSRGIRFLSLLQPQRPNEWRYAEYYNKRYNQFIDSSAAAFNAAGIGFINLHADSEIRKDHFFPGDDVHFNAAGAEAVAGIIAARIRDHNLLPAGPQSVPPPEVNPPATP
jgi:lysophospholipase L1-like esterase